MKPGIPISMVDTSTGGMKLVTRGKVRGRALKQQQGVGINETDVKVSIFHIRLYRVTGTFDISLPMEHHYIVSHLRNLSVIQSKLYKSISCSCSFLVHSYYTSFLIKMYTAFTHIIYASDTFQNTNAT